MLGLLCSLLDKSLRYFQTVRRKGLSSRRSHLDLVNLDVAGSSRTRIRGMVACAAVSAACCVLDEVVAYTMNLALSCMLAGKYRTLALLVIVDSWRLILLRTQSVAVGLRSITRDKGIRLLAGEHRREARRRQAPFNTTNVHKHHLCEYTQVNHSI